MPFIGTKVHNHLEKVDYETNEKKKFVLTGTVGEQWVIDAGKLASTYTLADGSPITPESLSKLVRKARNPVTGDYESVIPRFNVTTKPNGPTNWAIFIPVQDVFQIPTSWGDVLTVNAPGIPHGKGDFLVCADMNGTPNIADRWVVNGEIFADTYDMRAFPGMGTYHSIQPIDDRNDPREFRAQSKIVFGRESINNNMKVSKITEDIVDINNRNVDKTEVKEIYKSPDIVNKGSSSAKTTGFKGLMDMFKR